MPYVTTRLGRWYYEERSASPSASRRSGGRSNGTGGHGRNVIVLCHGLFFDGSQWEPQMETLVPLGRVIVFDGPGHGKSEVPPPFSLDDQTRALVDALDALDVAKVTVIGLGWGSMVAMRLAIGYPMRVSALGLIDATVEAPSLADRAKTRAFVMFARRFGTPRRLLERAIVPSYFAPRTRRERPDIVEAWLHKVAGFPREGLVRATKAVELKRTSIVRDLRSISAPSMVVCGREQSTAHVHQNELLAARLPRASLELIERAGRSSAVEQPEAVNTKLVQFLTAQREANVRSEAHA